MSIDGEQEIRQRLGRALGTVSAGPAPVDRAVRRGRAIRVRRRLGAAAGLAVVAAAAVAVPVLLHQQAAQHPVAPRPRHHAVTVHPPGPHAPAGLIAWGTIDGRHWGIRVTRPGAAPGGPGNQCVNVFGSTNCGPPMAYSGPDPAEFDGGSRGTGPGATAFSYGPVAPDVTYLTVRLAGGQVLRLHPVRVYGVRAAGFQAPSADVVSLTAYFRHGEPATAIPLHQPDGGLYIGTWLRPGAQALPRLTRVIGAGTTAGTAWSVTVYQGPWGRCVFERRPAGTNGGCYGSARLPGPAILGKGYPGGGDPPQLIWGTAPPRAAHVVVVMSDHSRIRARTVAAGRYRFFAAAVASTHLRPVRWLAYDQARQAVGHG